MNIPKCGQKIRTGPRKGEPCLLAKGHGGECRSILPGQRGIAEAVSTPSVDVGANDLARTAALDATGKALKEIMALGPDRSEEDVARIRKEWMDGFGGPWAETPRETLGGPEHYRRLRGFPPDRGQARQQRQWMVDWEKLDSGTLDRGESFYANAPKDAASRVDLAYPAHATSRADRDYWDAMDAVRKLERLGEPFGDSDIRKWVERRRETLFSKEAGQVPLLAEAVEEAMLEQTRREDRIAAFDDGFGPASTLALDRPWVNGNSADLLNRERR